MRHVVLEGLPATGKSEALDILSRFYPQQVAVLPEIVKQVAIRERIDVFRQRARLTKAILRELPHRREAIEEALARGALCLEESHLGVHLAYSLALGDRTFVSAYARMRDALPRPDLYLRLEAPIEVSLLRQRERGTPTSQVGRDVLEKMSAHLLAWHVGNKSRLLPIDADRPASEVLADLELALELTYTAPGPSLPPILDLLLLLGRPASGKSEFIDFMQKCPAERRAARYHVGRLQVVDDFPLLWEKFEEDDLWERLGHGRRYSRRAGGNYVVSNDAIWPFLIARIGERAKRHPSTRAAPPRETVILEFSRGGESAYADALRGLPPDLLARSAILYVSVTFEESLRRNLARYDAARASGILTHSVPEDEMIRTYARDDWPKLASGSQGFLDLDGLRVPYVTLQNEPESTDPDVLDRRYGDALGRLFALWQGNRH